MSVRETPVVSRFLDLKEKDTSYRKHMTAVRKSRPTVDTSQPDVPPRLQVAAVNNDCYRKGILRSYADHQQMIADATRPRTVPAPAVRHRSASHPRVVPTLAEEFNIFPPEPVLPSQRLSARLPPIPCDRPPREPPARRGDVVAVKIGYAEDAIVEEADADDVADE
jgi:hypothetical protein